ncbi:MAG: hypothetical protein KAS21_05985, partial [Candidatus Aminicenantes bacterium]|nr:hypothetical protein [Candidatus Aminicenantes bacterium]
QEKSDISEIVSNKFEIKGLPVIIHHFEDMSKKMVSTAADDIKRKGECATIISSNEGGKSAIVISIPSNLTKKVNASTLIKQIATIVNGNGGGRPDFAQAGGDEIVDPEGFRARVVELLENTK